ncbi:MarR family winged helix-turn-helix transcriptional regulator [Sphingoaurantiacus capsulatus]|uniref:MarR family winged helix-turn-helix transcriptional regulator n=1 Tax=Sphingoaurantiacus capsulatus TaxID=1771310 RepID=A0ABV7XG41_9SPHN
MNYPRMQGGAAIGARLRQLSERIDREAGQVYARLGVKFEQRWFGPLDQLYRNGPASVGTLARTLGISHAAVSQAASGLQAEGLITTSPDPSDARKRFLLLTDDGRRLADKLAPVWRAMSEAAAELDAAAGGVVGALNRLDEALTDQSLTDRIEKKL